MFFRKTYRGIAVIAVATVAMNSNRVRILSFKEMILSIVLGYRAMTAKEVPKWSHTTKETISPSVTAEKLWRKSKIWPSLLIGNHSNSP